MMSVASVTSSIPWRAILFLIFIQFLKISFHLQLLQNIGYVPHIDNTSLSLFYTRQYPPPTPPPLCCPLQLIPHWKWNWSRSVAQKVKCPVLCDPMDCSPPGSSVHGIFQARVLSGLPFPSPGPPWLLTTILFSVSVSLLLCVMFTSLLYFLDYTYK